VLFAQSVDGPVGVGEVLDAASVPRWVRVGEGAVGGAEVYGFEAVELRGDMEGESCEAARVVRGFDGQLGMDVNADLPGCELQGRRAMVGWST